MSPVKVSAGSKTRSLGPLAVKVVISVPKRNHSRQASDLVEVARLQSKAPPSTGLEVRLRPTRKLYFFVWIGFLFCAFPHFVSAALLGASPDSAYMQRIAALFAVVILLGATLIGASRRSIGVFFRSISFVRLVLCTVSATGLALAAAWTYPRLEFTAAKYIDGDFAAFALLLSSSVIALVIALWRIYSLRMPTTKLEHSRALAFDSSHHVDVESHEMKEVALKMDGSAFSPFLTLLILSCCLGLFAQNYFKPKERTTISQVSAIDTESAEKLRQGSLNAPPSCSNKCEAEPKCDAKCQTDQSLARKSWFLTLYLFTCAAVFLSWLALLEIFGQTLLRSRRLESHLLQNNELLVGLSRGLGHDAELQRTIGRAACAIASPIDPVVAFSADPPDAEKTTGDLCDDEFLVDQ